MGANPNKNTKQQLEEYLENFTPRKSVVENELCEVVQQTLATLDFEEYERVKAYHMREEVATRPSKYKYFDLLFYLKNKLRRVIALGLHQRPPLRILDIGAGPSHFGYLCQHYGHSVLATDISDGTFEGCQRPDEDSMGENNAGGEGEVIYGDLNRLFGVRRETYRVEAFTPSPDFGQKFDLITAFMIKFNFYWLTEELWGLEEWDYLLKDFRDNQLAKDGEIFFQLNRSEHYTGFHIDAPEFAAFVRSRGGTIDLEQCTLQFQIESNTASSFSDVENI